MFLPLWLAISKALDLLQLIIIADVIMSYIPSLPRRNPIVVLVHTVASWVLDPIRKVIRPLRMGNAYLDISPIVAILAIQFLQTILL